MPKTAIDKRHLPAPQTADALAVQEAVDDLGGPKSVASKVLGRLMHAIEHPDGRNGAATAVTASRVMLDWLRYAYGSQGNTGSTDSSPLVVLNLGVGGTGADRPGDVIDAPLT